MYRARHDLRSFRVDYEFAVLAVCRVVFAVVGAGCSLVRENTDVLLSTVSVALAFAYYVISAVLRSLGNEGLLSPRSSCVGSQRAFGALGVGLIVRGDRLV